MYEECFPKFKIRLNQRKNLSPCIAKGIKKSSKRKQKLYEKFLKKRNAFNETACKAYESLFKAIKRKSKKNHYSQKILQFKYDIKKRWTVMKEIIVKAKHSKKSNFPPKLKIGNKIKTGEDEIIYVNDLPSASNLLNTIMFANTNLFPEHKDKRFFDSE